MHLDGDIGCIGNGAGLTMNTLDLVKQHGGEPACFLDIGGGANAERVRNALDMVLLDPKVRGVFINVFGGITRGDEVARGIITARDELHITKPLVVRMTGTMEEEGRKLLQEAGIVPGRALLRPPRRSSRLDARIVRHELRRTRWGGHELRRARGRNAFAVPPLALAGGGSPGCETALLRSCPPHPGSSRSHRRPRVSVLVDRNSRVLIQGITGREGSFHTGQMRAFGTNVVAGVSPGKGGE